MTMEAFTKTATAWLNPSTPGKGKNLIVLILLAFLLGPIGVGIGLRSLLDFMACLVTVFVIRWFTGVDLSMGSAIVSVIWVVMRACHDSRDASAATRPSATVEHVA